ncbi:uncharacterized [Tachysurus ichikawai]
MSTPNSLNTLPALTFDNALALQLLPWDKDSVEVLGESGSAWIHSRTSSSPLGKEKMSFSGLKRTPEEEQSRLSFSAPIQSVPLKSPVIPLLKDVKEMERVSRPGSSCAPTAGLCTTQHHQDTPPTNERTWARGIWKAKEATVALRRRV